MSLKNSIDNLKFDARMVDINSKSRLVSAEELAKHLDKLPDLKDRCANLDIENSVDSDSYSAHEDN